MDVRLRPARLALFGVALGLAACGEDPGLEGSIGKTVPLDFNQTSFKKQGDFLLVEYLRRTAAATEIMCKLAADISAINDDRIFAGQRFLDHVTLTRATLDETRFPPIRRGTLRLGELAFEHGGDVSGSFHVEFIDDETLDGSFSGTLVEITVK